MDYKITKDSIEAAKREFKEYLRSPFGIEPGFNAALDALCVPVEDNQICGMECFVDNKGYICGLKKYHHGDHDWKIIIDDHVKAQFQPKPIVPGSWFRLPNGDELRIIADADFEGTFTIINSTRGETYRIYSELWFTETELRKALKDVGAVEINL